MSVLTAKIKRKIANIIQMSMSQLEMSSISNAARIHPTAKIINSTLHARMEVGKNSVIKDTCIMGSDIFIGRNTSLWGPNIDIYSMLNPVRIGSFCSIARNVSMQEYNHRIDRCSTYFIASNVFNENMAQDIDSRGPIIIGNDVWIGSHVVIVSGANIGDGAVIGANSVVIGDVPPYAVVAGSPAKLIRYRFDDTIINKLLEIRWWEWEDERILNNRSFFLEPLSVEILDSIV
jgi:acetyltransferase-like isoleucine patch superfamily enzyme